MFRCAWRLVRTPLIVQSTSVSIDHWRSIVQETSLSVPSSRLDVSRIPPSASPSQPHPCIPATSLACCHSKSWLQTQKQREATSDLVRQFSATDVICSTTFMPKSAKSKIVGIYET